MQAITAKRVLMVLIAVLSLSLMIGCAGKEYCTQRSIVHVWYYHKELPEADQGCRSSASSRQG